MIYILVLKHKLTYTIHTIVCFSKGTLARHYTTWHIFHLYRLPLPTPNGGFFCTFTSCDECKHAKYAEGPFSVHLHSNAPLAYKPWPKNVIIERARNEVEATYADLETLISISVVLDFLAVLPFRVHSHANCCLLYLTVISDRSAHMLYLTNWSVSEGWRC